MAERFRDAIKAAQYVSQGLLHDFPEASVEAFRLGKAKSRFASCATNQLERVLVEMCRGLTAVSVDYHPANEYGFVAEVIEELNGQSKSALPRRVFIILTQVKGRPIAVGSRLAGRPLVDLK